ncbi:DUF2848 domain-containing protein [Xanthobacter sp. KR7-225]|uniref:DUF2848 domain-containing protein n=1 Tax=Xanthobacter sp. KR7-225 TaxID=3156613 RepID=UPI0032B32922
MLAFRKIRRTGEEDVRLTVRALVLGGLTGTPDSVERHLEELEAIGVRRPGRAPVFFRLTANLATRADSIQVVGPRTSGEVEPVLVALPDGIWLGVGSDHTDRGAETIDIPLSKQLCPKPIGEGLWPLEEVADHWDRLVVRSFIEESGRRVVYQEDRLAEMLHPDILLAKLAEAVAPLPQNGLFMCGTPPALGGIRPSPSFEVELVDPVLDRRLSHAYRVEMLENPPL